MGRGGRRGGGLTGGGRQPPAPHLPLPRGLTPLSPGLTKGTTPPAGRAADDWVSPANPEYRALLTERRLHTQNGGISGMRPPLINVRPPLINWGAPGYKQPHLAHPRAEGGTSLYFGCTDTQTHRHRHTYTHHTHTYRQTDRQTDRQTHTHTHTHTRTHRTHAHTHTPHTHTHPRARRGVLPYIFEVQTSTLHSRSALCKYNIMYTRRINHMVNPSCVYKGASRLFTNCFIQKISCISQDRVRSLFPLCMAVSLWYYMVQFSTTVPPPPPPG